MLHQTFPPGSLDFMFLTAAAGAVFGVPGQGAYAAANAYLDGLAQARHRQGCNTVSQDWVAWHGLGFGAEAQIALQELQRLGSRAITAEEAFAAWDHLARYDVAQAVMAPMIVGRYVGARRAARSDAALGGDAGRGRTARIETGLWAILARSFTARGRTCAGPAVRRTRAELGHGDVGSARYRAFVGIELSATMLFNYPTVMIWPSFWRESFCRIKNRTKTVTR